MYLMLNSDSRAWLLLNITDTGYFARRLEEGEVKNDTDFIMTTTAMVVGVRRVNDNNYPIIYIHWPTAGWMCGGFAILLGCNSIGTLNFGRKIGRQTGPHSGPNSVLEHYKF